MFLQTSDRKLRPFEKIFKILSHLSPTMCYGHAMFVGNSQIVAGYFSSPVYRCRIDQTVN